MLVDGLMSGARRAVVPPIGRARGGQREPNGPLDESGSAHAPTMSRRSPPRRLRGDRPRLSAPVHQRLALDAIERRQGPGATSPPCLVLPPGARQDPRRSGGGQAARPADPRLGPNTAIQAQWIAEWERFRPATVKATADRELPTLFTALTYQAMCTVDGEYADDEPELTPGRAAAQGTAAGHGRPRLGGVVRACCTRTGRELIERLEDQRPRTLVLDECHHLLELWGPCCAPCWPARRPVRARPDRHPAGHDDRRHRPRVHQALFGPRRRRGVHSAAGTGTGQLARTRSWRTSPRPRRRRRITSKPRRNASPSCRTDLLRPELRAPPPFLEWLQSRVVERRSAGHAADGTAGREGVQVSWSRFERDAPGAGGRGSTAARPPGCCRCRRARGDASSTGARRPQTDRVTLLGDYCRNCLPPGPTTPRDAAASPGRPPGTALGRLHAHRHRGTRWAPPRSTGSLARSASKSQARRSRSSGPSRPALGDRLRALVLCDHERAAAELPRAAAPPAARGARSARGRRVRRGSAGVSRRSGRVWRAAPTAGPGGASRQRRPPGPGPGFSIRSWSPAGRWRLRRPTAERLVAWLRERDPRPGRGRRTGKVPGRPRRGDPGRNRVDAAPARAAGHPVLRGGRIAVPARTPGLLGEGWDAKDGERTGSHRRDHGDLGGPGPRAGAAPRSALAGEGGRQLGRRVRDQRPSQGPRPTMTGSCASTTGTSPSPRAGTSRRASPRRPHADAVQPAAAGGVSTGSTPGC